MRLFIAIDMPEKIKEELKATQQQLPKGKLTLAKEFHITLKFLGEVKEEKIEELKEKLAKIKFKRSQAAIDKIGVFPSENYIRVVWAGIKPEKDIIELQNKIDAEIGKEYPDDYKFSPHITLARVKFVDNKKQFIQQLENIKIKKKNLPWTASSSRKAHWEGAGHPMRIWLIIDP